MEAQARCACACGALGSAAHSYDAHHRGCFRGMPQLQNRCARNFSILPSMWISTDRRCQGPSAFQDAAMGVPCPCSISWAAGIRRCSQLQRCAQRAQACCKCRVSGSNAVCFAKTAAIPFALHSANQRRIGRECRLLWVVPIHRSSRGCFGDSDWTFHGDRWRRKRRSGLHSG